MVLADSIGFVLNEMTEDLYWLGGVLAIGVIGMVIGFLVHLHDQIILEPRRQRVRQAELELKAIQAKKSVRKGRKVKGEADGKPS